MKPLNKKIEKIPNLLSLFDVKKDLSIITLILMNMLPLAGVLFFEWNLFSIMFLYWAESAVIGFYNVFKIALARQKDGEKTYIMKVDGTEVPIKSEVNTYGNGNLALVIFFIFHYGMFMSGHGVFIFALFGSAGKPAEGLTLVFLSLLFSHGISFFRNYVGKREYLKSSPGRQMFQPYIRIFTMHVVILAGGMVAMALHAPVMALALLVFLKTAADLTAHVLEHRITESAPAPDVPEESGKTPGMWGCAPNFIVFAILLVFFIAAILSLLQN